MPAHNQVMVRLDTQFHVLASSMQEHVHVQVPLAVEFLDLGHAGKSWVRLSADYGGSADGVVYDFPLVGLEVGIGRRAPRVEIGPGRLSDCRAVLPSKGGAGSASGRKQPEG